MKLLICTPEYYPHGSGIANVIYNVGVQLKKQGVTCTICSPTGPDIILGSTKLIEKFGFIGLVYYWYQVSRFFKDNDYDIVWLQNPFIVSHNPFPRCLVTMHSTYYGMSLRHVGNTRFFRTYYKIISKIEEYCLLHMGKKILFVGVGRSVCNELECLGIEKEQITFIPLGVDSQLFRPTPDKNALRKKFGFLDNDIILLSVGRLTHAKQPQTIIKVFSHLEKRIADLTLCIAGRGELLDSVKHMVDVAGLQKVMFLGHVDHSNDLPDIYAISDYFIITSIYEGGRPPLSLSEAMASGLPCIGSDISNFRIINDANCGIIVNFEDTEHAANEILEYISGQHSDHAKNARDYAVKFLEWEIISKQYMKFLFPTLPINGHNSCTGSSNPE